MPWSGRWRQRGSWPRAAQALTPACWPARSAEAKPTNLPCGTGRAWRQACQGTDGRRPSQSRRSCRRARTTHPANPANDGHFATTIVRSAASLAVFQLRSAAGRRHSRRGQPGCDIRSWLTAAMREDRRCSDPLVRVLPAGASFRRDSGVAAWVGLASWQVPHYVCGDPWRGWVSLARCMP